MLSEEDLQVCGLPKEFLVGDLLEELLEEEADLLEELLVADR
jgi:hypothetical protein